MNQKSVQSVSSVVKKALCSPSDKGQKECTGRCVRLGTGDGTELFNAAIVLVTFHGIQIGGPICTRSAIEAVSAHAASQGVVATTGVQSVITLFAKHPIVAGAADERIILTAA